MNREMELRELAGTEPDLNVLREEFLFSVQRRDSNVFARQRLNYTSRYCIWAGQTLDGRKWGSEDKEPFPWQGASDARVHLIDRFINEDVAKLMVVWRRNRITVSGTEANDEELGTRLTQLLRWQVSTQLKEARREARFCGNYLLERGAAVVGCWWEKVLQLGYDNVDLESVKGLAMGVAQGQEMAGGLPEGITAEDVVNLPGWILDPSSEDRAVGVASRVYPEMGAAEVRQGIRSLRQKGSARFARPYLKRDRPRLCTLALNEDVFLPPEATGIDDELTGLDRRELLSETTLRSRVQGMGWDEGWVEEVIRTQRGRLSADFDGSLMRRGTAGLMSRGIPDVSRLFEVVHAYRRQGDENGVPGIYLTYYSPGLCPSGLAQGGRRRKSGSGGRGYGWHGLLDYDHGEYPFTLFTREDRSRLVDDARGYGEIGSTWQQQVKGEWDQRMDRASITTCPPSYYPHGEAPDRWGPGVRIATRRPEEYGFVKTPPYDPMSKEVEGTVERFARGYFGRVVDESNVVEAGAVQQELADNWMDGWGRVYTQLLQLDQQYMPDEIYFRVVGSSKGKALHLGREEIQGEFDVRVGMTVEDLDPTKVKDKIGLIESALQMDVNGRIDRDEAINYVFELIDPSVGERLLQSGEDANAKQVEETKSEFAQMMLGIPVDVKPSGQAYRLKLQVLEQLLQENPTAQQRFSQDEQAKGVLERYVKMLKFQVTQHEVNPMVGRMGAK